MSTLTGRMQGYAFTVRKGSDGSILANVGLIATTSPDMDHAFAFVSSWVSYWTRKPSPWAVSSM